MNKTKLLFLMALVAMSKLVIAHHGTAGSYDHNKVVQVEGVVKEFWWRNPHSALFVDGKGNTGAKGTFVLELGSPKTLAGMGYHRKTFQPGDKVVISMWQSYTNPVNGQFMHSKYVVNGKELRSTNGKN